MAKDVRGLLREVYRRGVEERERRPATVWEIAQRDAFLALLQEESAGSPIELGAATGADSAFFADHRLRVVRSHGLFCLSVGC
jgi:hypothetical protein